MSVKALRSAIGMSQVDIAKILGINRSTVAKWETGKAKPRFDKLPELAKILGCSIDDLFKSEPK